IAMELASSEPKRVVSSLIRDIKYPVLYLLYTLMDTEKSLVIIFNLISSMILALIRKKSTI
ncbi:MAG: hypothetical protein PHS36_08565, partial [Candidatus Cloacimonetes bacterium]|nr:hypothetical protein [Candidatus Cloacimonadota bacterium]